MAAWSIAQDERRGRHLLAQQRFSAGQQILSQRPYAAVLYDAKQPQLCDHTFQPAPKLKRCARCKLVWYSNQEAQKAAWPAHRRECKALARIAPRVPPPTVRLAARVLWRSEDQAQEGDEAASAGNGRTLGSGRFAEVQLLEHHWEQLSAERKTSFAQMAGLTGLYMYGKVDADVGVPAKDIARLLSAFACNNHTICNTELQPLGVGLYPTGATINHSCQPNAVQSFEGSSIVFRAVRSIEPGEEVTISYTDLKATRPERRAFLLQHYHFDIDAGAVAQGAQDAEAATAMEEAHGSGPRLRVSVSLRPSGPLNDIDRQLTGLPARMAGHQLPDAFVLTECLQGGSRSSIAAGDSLDPSSAARTTFSSMESAIAALEAGDEGPDPRQHIRVQCWGQSFFTSSSGNSSSSSSGHHAGPAGSTAAGVASSNGSDRNGCSADADAKHDAAAALNQQLVSVYRFAAIHCYVALDEAEQMLADGGGGTFAARRLQAALAQFAKAFGPHHGLLLRLRDTLLRAAVAAQQWELALQTARELLPTYQLIYTQPWPDLGLLWAHIAKVAALLELDDEAGEAAETAARILQITNGDRCDVVIDMLRLRRDIQASRQVPPSDDDL